jgi:hypothetical protein
VVPLRSRRDPSVSRVSIALHDRLDGANQPPISPNAQARALGKKAIVRGEHPSLNKPVLNKKGEAVCLAQKGIYAYLMTIVRVRVLRHRPKSQT